MAPGTAARRVQRRPGPRATAPRRGRPSPRRGHREGTGNPGPGKRGGAPSSTARSPGVRGRLGRLRGRFAPRVWGDGGRPPEAGPPAQSRIRPDEERRQRSSSRARRTQGPRGGRGARGSVRSPAPPPRRPPRASRPRPRPRDEPDLDRVRAHAEAAQHHRPPIRPVLLKGRGKRLPRLAVDAEAQLAAARARVGADGDAERHLLAEDEQRAGERGQDFHVVRFEPSLRRIVEDPARRREDLERANWGGGCCRHERPLMRQQRRQQQQQQQHKQGGVSSGDGSGDRGRGCRGIVDGGASAAAESSAWFSRSKNSWVRRRRATRGTGTSAG